MQCKSCGNILPPRAKHCPNCGTPVFSPSPFQETASSSASSADVQADRMVSPAHNLDSYQETVSASASPSSDVEADKTMLPAFNSGPFQESVSRPPIAEANRAVLLGGYPYIPAPPSTDPTAQKYGQSSMQPPRADYATSKPPSQRNRGLSRGMTILLIMLALLIMFSGIGLIYYTTVYHPNELRVQATGTAQAIETRDARSTATANAQATGTAVAYANATATAQAQATAAAQATATALQNIYTSATRGSPVLDDSLAGDSGSGWDEDLAVGGGGCAFTDGTYHASLYKTGYYFPCIARNTDFSNLAFQVQMTITKGDEGGLIFRADGTNTKFYAFRVGTNGIYDLFTTQDNSHSSELAYGTSPSFNKNVGQTNLLTIIARGSNIYFYINKQYVGSINDSTYKSGQIGLFAEDHTNPTDVAFSNAQVWKL